MAVAKRAKITITLSVPDTATLKATEAAITIAKTMQTAHPQVQVEEVKVRR